MLDQHTHCPHHVIGKCQWMETVAWNESPQSSPGVVDLGELDEEDVGVGLTVLCIHGRAPDTQGWVINQLCNTNTGARGGGEVRLTPPRGRTSRRDWRGRRRIRVTARCARSGTCRQEEQPPAPTISKGKLGLERRDSGTWTRRRRCRRARRLARRGREASRVLDRRRAEGVDAAPRRCRWSWCRGADRCRPGLQVSGWGRPPAGPVGDGVGAAASAGGHEEMGTGERKGASRLVLQRRWMA